jgi:hypothetical protein
MEEAGSFFKETQTSFLVERSVKPCVGISQDQARAFFNSAWCNVEVPSNYVAQALPDGRLAGPPQYNVTNVFVVSPTFTPNGVCQPYFPASFDSSTGGHRYSNPSMPMHPFSFN